MIHPISPLPPQQWQATWPRTLVILGSTGSIGTSALQVIRLQPERFTILGLAGANNLRLLAEQAAEFRPPFLAVLNQNGAEILRSLLPEGYTPTILTGENGYAALASLEEASTVLSAQVGAAGLRGTYAAAKSGKVIALANKESLVLAGGLIRKTMAESGAVILPVDSEHNALFQCMHGAKPESVTRLILTASGGPFRDTPAEELHHVTTEQALRHPNWNMGAKITIDSATLMNKGLELIEACHLFGVPMEHIDVLIHKESIVHSLVEYADGSQLAQMGVPDMRVAIAYALGYPERITTGVPKLSLAKLGSLSFVQPDEKAFRALNLARLAMRRGKGAPVVLNAANEIAVSAFLDQRISFLGITELVERTMQAHFTNGSETEPETIDDILALDAKARALAQCLL